jgi:transposase
MSVQVFNFVRRRKIASTISHAPDYAERPPIERMARVQNLDHIGRGFIRLSRGDIPEGLRCPASTGECRRKPGVPRRPGDCGRLTQGALAGAIFPVGYAQIAGVTSPREHPIDGLPNDLPNDLASAHAMILAQRELLAEREAALTEAQSDAKVRALEIERLKLQLAKARREHFGQSSERSKLLVEQLELAIEDLEETQAEEEARAEIAAPEPSKAQRRRPQRGPRKLPDNLPVERVVEPAPCVCGKCGGDRLRKLGEVVSKTLECEPRRWKIIEHVREKFACRDCDGVSEPPAPSHPIPRGFAGPSLLAMILVGKFCDHLPLNRQSAAFAREGIEIEVSTLADWVGGCAAALEPILAELRAHVLAAERLHVDDTTVKVLAKTKTRTGRLWVYVRDDRPFGGQGPPAALYDYSPTRHGEYPRKVLVAWSGVMQADAFSGYNALYEKGRRPAPVLEAACWAHGRRDFFDFAKLTKAPIAVEIVRRIDELFTIERATTANRPRNGARPGRSDRSRSSPRSRATCASNSSGCRRRTTSPRRSTTC